MSADGVHSYEMPTTPDDDWPTDDPVLAAFAEDLRIVASGPAPEPRPGLVAAMRQGPIVPMGLQHERKTKRMPVKTFLGSLVAKLALGVGIATASVTAAGAAGVLPDAAQHAVSTVVDATTPFSIPDGSTVHAADVPLVDGSTTTTSTTVASSTTSTSTSTSTTVATKGTDDGTDTGGTAGVHPDNHGACVSTAAQSDTSSTGENHGKAVSAVAKSDCGKTTSTTVGSSTTSSTPTTVGGANPGATTNSGPGNSNGHGNSSGKGSSSKGGSGQD